MDEFQKRPLIRGGFAMRIGMVFLFLTLLPLAPYPEMPVATSAIGVAFIVWGTLSYDKSDSN